MKVTVETGQSLTDIAIQVYGSAEGAFILAKENGLSVTSQLKAGDVLSYSSDKVIDKRVVDYYAKNGIKPVTGFGSFERKFDETFDLTFN